MSGNGTGTALVSVTVSAHVPRDPVVDCYDLDVWWQPVSGASWEVSPTPAAHADMTADGSSCASGSLHVSRILVLLAMGLLTIQNQRVFNHNFND